MDRNRQGNSLRDHISAAARMTREQRAEQRQRKHAQSPAPRPVTSGGRDGARSQRNLSDGTDRPARNSKSRSTANRETAGGGASRNRTSKAASDKRDSKRSTRGRSDSASHPSRRKDRAEGEGKQRRFHLAGKSRVVLVVLGILVLCCVVLYPVGKDYYHTMREGQRLQAQIDAVDERNVTLEEETESLQTDEGIEAQARNDYNYVKEGEHAASVTNAQGSPGATDLPVQIDEDDIKAPQTWYYTILDVIFFYSD